MTKSRNHIKEAFLKGYHVNEEGEAISPYGKKLSCNISRYGYKKFGIRDSNGERATIFVHRLIAYQKYGEDIFKQNIQVRHLDGNPSNNKPNNIALGTQSENMMDIPEDARINNAKHASSFRIKYNNQKIELIKQDRELGMKYSEIMTKYEITSKGTLSYIINYR